MRRTLRRRLKENEHVKEAGSENVESSPKRPKNRRAVAAAKPDIGEKKSKYFSKSGKEPLTPLQNDTVKTVQKLNKKASEHSDKPSTESFTDGALENQNSIVRDNSGEKYDFSDEVLQDQFKADLLSKGLQMSSKQCRLNVYRPVASRSRNMLHYFEQLSIGMRGRLELQKSVQSPFVELFTDMEVLRVASPFDRRVTALEWHPTRPNILAIGSKGGDIIWWDIETYGKEKHHLGIGAAGSCQAMKFWPWDQDKVVSASINGTVTLHDLETKENTTLVDTMDSHDHWYCSLDVNRDRNMVAAGRNHGILHVMSREGNMIFEHRLHKNKITHVEFSPREEWLLCTASTDHTVQLWDIRQMKDRKSALQVLKHEKPVNSGYFSHTDGCRLLTTDQGTEIRVYRSPSWHLERTILHPHRFFQHITPFKATWHPLQDLIVCGRYPDKNFPGYSANDSRSIDMFDADTGELLSQLRDPTASGLCSINKFNWQGDALASSMGFHTIVWNRQGVPETKQKGLLDSFVKYMDNPAAYQPNRGYIDMPLPRPRKRNTDSDTDNLKKKKKGSRTAEKSGSTSVNLKNKTKMSKKEK